MSLFMSIVYQNHTGSNSSITEGVISLKLYCNVFNWLYFTNRFRTIQFEIRCLFKPSSMDPKFPLSGVIYGLNKRSISQKLISTSTFFVFPKKLLIFIWLANSANQFINSSYIWPIMHKNIDHVNVRAKRKVTKRKHNKKIAFLATRHQ
jgi:hypothetical protein